VRKYKDLECCCAGIESCCAWIECCCIKNLMLLYKKFNVVV
jgi:hypothetical protein